MHTLSLAKSTKTENPHWEDLLKSLAQFDQRQQVRVYNTYVWDVVQKDAFVFRTTTKDLHLKIGLLPLKFQLNLARVLHWHFDHCVDGQSQILLFEEGRSDPVLVTRTKELGETVFTLVPTH